MAKTPQESRIVEVKPQPNVYTVLLVIAVLSLLVATGLGLRRLLSPLEDGGYGLTFNQLIEGTIPEQENP